MRSLVEYFAQRPFVANVIMIGLILTAIFLWDVIGKEERPEFAMPWVRFTVPYPGASAEDVELFVIKPIEEQLKGLSGLYEVNSSASFGAARFTITLAANRKLQEEKYQEIKDAVDRADLPTETEDPTYWRFNSAEKAIIDIALYLEGKDLLEVTDRQVLQQYALTLKSQLLSLPEVSGVDMEGYLKPEIQIKVDPKKLIKLELPLGEVASQIQSQHLRTPVGVMADKYESEVSLRSFLDDIEPLKQAVLRNSFQGTKTVLSDIAKVEHGFERTTSIHKIQGHEAVVMNIKKSSGIGILKAREAIILLTDRFAKSHSQTAVRIKLLDDESYEVRNRLQLISSNGLAGFFVILLILFFFLDFKSGFWVAMGIPFSLAVTLIGCFLVGYTVNNMTLAAVIIVLGIVVDDAIIIADSIAQHKKQTADHLKATSIGVISVFLPVVAGVLTTCVAFIPLLFFAGRFGMFVKYIPLVVAIMLIASLFESFFILPAHLHPSKKLKEQDDSQLSRLNQLRLKILLSLEAHYVFLLIKVLHYRVIVLAIFIALLLGSGYLLQNKLKYVMFPREEPKEFAVQVVADTGVHRREMAEITKKVEKLFIDDKFNAVVGVRTVIGESRRGGQVHENRASLRIEIIPPDQLKVSPLEMMAYWEAEAKKIPEIKEVQFLKSWWGHDSGSPVAIEILENNDKKRKEISEALFAKLKNYPELKNVEIEKPIVKTEYGLELDRAETLRLGIDASQLARTLRAYIEGQILYRLYTEEEIDVRLTSLGDAKVDIHQILKLPAANSQGYLVPIKQLVGLVPRQKPVNIQRVNYKRADYIYADLTDGAARTPLEIADHLENNVFPDLAQQSPTTLFNFRGEIEDSRDAQNDFMVSLIMTLMLIYVILTFMFGSLIVPFAIISIIPFGMAGVVLAFWAHGMVQFGFFAVVGVIGMLGVVINDSIVMVDRFQTVGLGAGRNFSENLANIAKTRLRPIILTTLTTVAGVFPTAYGVGGYDAMLADMMLAMGWGLIFGTFITLFLMPIIYSYILGMRKLSP